MLAPNPNTPRPTRRHPWEIPADLPMQTLQPYGHRIACEVAARHIGRAMAAAARVFADAPQVYTGDVPFASCADAARFLLAAGVDKSEHTLAQGILRACRSGKPYCGRRWRYAVAETV